MFGNLGGAELLFILVIALLIFGPRRLPEIGRMVGKGLAEFRRASTELKRTINAELEIDEGVREAEQRVSGTRSMPGPLRPAAQTTPRGGLSNPSLPQADESATAEVAPGLSHELEMMPLDHLASESPALSRAEALSADGPAAEESARDASAATPERDLAPV